MMYHYFWEPLNLSIWGWHCWDFCRKFELWFTTDWNAAQIHWQTPNTGLYVFQQVDVNQQNRRQNADHDGLWVKHGQTKNTLFGETLHNLSQGMGWQCKRPPPRLMHPIASRFNKDIFDKFQRFFPWNIDSWNLLLHEIIWQAVDLYRMFKPTVKTCVHSWVLHMGVCQNLLSSMLVGWTPIYQLFWCSIHINSWPYSIHGSSPGNTGHERNLRLKVPSRSLPGRPGWFQKLTTVPCPDHPWCWYIYLHRNPINDPVL